MLATCNWLRELAPGLPEPEELGQILTDIGLEVEAGYRAGPELANVIAGRIASSSRTAGLRECLIDIGADQQLRVACSASNAKKGRMVALALPGASIGEREVAVRDVNGIRSEGMLCSSAELGLGEDASQLLELERRTKPGTPLDVLLETDDYVFDLAVTPNRGDWLSMLGIVRELAARCALPAPRIRQAGQMKPVTADAYLAHIDDGARHSCPKFCCLPVSGVNAAAPTPALICQRLLRCGVRPVSIIVDLTNYVMLELGQPLHAFDRSRLNGDLQIRMARAGEQLPLIDGTLAKLTEQYLVVADSAQAQAIGGVMGGSDSAISAATSDILLEAAHFTPAAIRGRTRELNISSEAAFRFERGVNPQLCETALWRTARLIKKYCGGAVGTLRVTGAAPQQPKSIALADGQTEKLTGVQVPLKEAARRLKALGFDVAKRQKQVVAGCPPWRFDVERKEDLIEEVIRFGGYSALPTTMPLLTGTFTAAPTLRLDATQARDRLAQDGYHEIITYAFVSPQWELDFYASTTSFTLANPLAEELSVMRSGLLGGLVDCAVYNQRRRQQGLQLFEIGRCFDAASDTQPLRLAALGWGLAGSSLWNDRKRTYDFFDARGSLARLLPGIALEFHALDNHPALHPGRAATITLDDEPLGIVGELHPALLEKHRYPLEPAPVAFELNLDLLLRRSHTYRFVPVSKLPLVQRDLSVIVADQTTAAQLLKSVAEISMGGFSEITDVEVFDSFCGKGIPPSKRNIGLRVFMQGADANLVEERINAAMEAIVVRLRRDHQIEVRG